MSIKDRVNDAEALIATGRHIGAFAQLMIAVAASSRKAFPKGETKSLVNKNDVMRDPEAFTWFLGGRIYKLLFNSTTTEEYGSSGLSILFEGENRLIEHIIYVYFRCSLLHEGQLPENVDFVDACENESGALRASIEIGERLILGAGWINLIAQAVIYARVNGEEFGIEHRFLSLKNNGEDSAVVEMLIARYDITLGRVEILKDVVLKVGDYEIERASDQEIVELFKGLVSDGLVTLGDLSGLMTRGLVDDFHVLTCIGVSAIRDVAHEYRVERT